MTYCQYIVHMAQDNGYSNIREIPQDDWRQLAQLYAQEWPEDALQGLWSRGGVVSPYYAKIIELMGSDLTSAYIDISKNLINSIVAEIDQDVQQKLDEYWADYRETNYANA